MIKMVTYRIQREDVVVLDRIVKWGFVGSSNVVDVSEWLPKLLIDGTQIIFEVSDYRMYLFNKDYKCFFIEMEDIEDILTLERCVIEGYRLEVDI